MGEFIYFFKNKIFIFYFFSSLSSSSKIADSSSSSSVKFSRDSARLTQNSTRLGSFAALGQRHQPPYISRMEPVQREAYGGGLYGKEEGQPNRPAGNPPASSTQSADGPDEATTKKPKHKPPPSSGDCDADITGQAYLQ
ncbi:uncharacterized protein [Coffea arabica]|uniref:Uncharacterized protein n=1 Tax=Coffea arabica TaxID=13443 RepID=A0ABM4VX47_COFAR